MAKIRISEQLRRHTGMMTETKHTPCPSCNYPLQAASDVLGDAKPVPGDFSVCINCLCGLVFNEDLSVRKANTQERAVIDIHPDIIRVRRAIMETRLFPV